MGCAQRVQPDCAIVVDMADLHLLVGFRFCGVDFLGGDNRTDIPTMVRQSLLHYFRSGVEDSIIVGLLRYDRFGRASRSDRRQVVPASTAFMAAYGFSCIST